MFRGDTVKPRNELFGAFNQGICFEFKKLKSFIQNENINDGHGAGTKAAEKMAELKVQKIISGDFGPKAKDLLDKFNIQMVIIQDYDSTIQDVINKLKK